MKNTKTALFHAVVALLLCVSMLVGTTMAWFTDSVTTGVNQIVAGNLDIELEYYDGGAWKPVESDKSVFRNGIRWEPGHTEVVYLRIVNKGNLALKYRLGVSVDSETLSMTASGDAIQLSKYIHFGAIDGVTAPYADRDAARGAVQESKPLTAGYTKPGTMTAKDETAYVALVVYMPESVGNEANHAANQPAPSINLGISLLATQMNSESDSFGSDYDQDSLYPGGIIDFSVMAPVAADASGAVAAETTVGNEGEIHAVVPAGVQLIDPNAGLGLDIATKNGTDSNVRAKAGETMKPMDIKMPNLSPDNQELIKVTIPGLLQKGLNTTSVKMYHVEDGVTKEMTLVALADLDAHNEFYYDPATGDVTICTMSFSEYVTVADDWNRWEGNYDTSWYNTTDTEFTLYTADQLAGFGAIVDGGYKKPDGEPVTLTADTFTGKTVYLGKDIDLGGKVSFNPIGCGYVNGTKNSNGIEGKAFEGTFDGQNHVIRNLYQNGWDLGLSYCTLGGGLFASVHNAIICNLTMVDADIVMECVEQGVVVGLAQGECTFDNINIYNCSVANYQRATGGVVGEVSWGAGDADTFTHTFSNIKIDTQTVIGSLWGDFDAPVGGVIGGYWDDSGRTRVTMNNVDVACRLDVYNDVTSSYQWYAYRRAGMLIGNSEQVAADGRTAAAPFLTCDSVVVRYGNWVNYHYCEFGEEHNSPSWPWVRVEAGENCNAYSNPRWGAATDAEGNLITNAHTQENHADGDGHNQLIAFNQLYGGGQGVYGQTTHDGVTIENYIYAITYVNNGVVLDTVYVKNNGSAQDTKNDTAEQAAMEGITDDKITFKNWINAGSTVVTEIPKNNTNNVILYPSYDNLYTAIFVDQQGNILNWTTFTTSDTSKVTAMAESLKSSVPETDELTFDYWEVHVTDANGNTTTKKALDEYTFGKTDITLYPVYTYNGDVNLIPVDNNGDGIIDEYHVGGYSNPNGQALVRIPDEVNGIKITAIQANAFASYDGVHSVVIPKSVTVIGDNAFAEKWGTIDSGETISIYYAGSRADWEAKEKEFGSDWESGISSSTRIFFLNGGDKVDVTQGYLQAEVKSSWGNRTVTWNLTTITSAIIDEYTGHCDCEISTTGDTAHIYVRVNSDGTETLMLHNANGTPVNEQEVEIYWGTIKEGFIGIGKEEGLRDDDTNDTYKRYRPDKVYWEGVTIN